MVTWSTWHDSLPGCFFVEEVCEATLSRLNSALKHRPQLVTVEQVSDLFTIQEVLSPDVAHPVSRHNPTARLKSVVSQSLRSLMRANPGAPSYVAWLSGQRMCTACSEWPLDVWFPASVWNVPCQDDLRDMVLYSALLLIRGDAPTASPLMDDTFRRQDADDELAATEELDRGVQLGSDRVQALGLRRMHRDSHGVEQNVTGPGGARTGDVHAPAGRGRGARTSSTRGRGRASQQTHPQSPSHGDPHGGRLVGVPDVEGDE